jgi:hypothetical protein
MPRPVHVLQRLFSEFSKSFKRAKLQFIRITVMFCGSVVAGTETGARYGRCSECGVEVLESDTSMAPHRPVCRFD